MMKQIKNNDFSEVKNSAYAVVDFSASWCGPCKMMAPAFHAVAEEKSDVADFFGADVDDNQDLAMSNKVFSVPTLIIYKAGVEVARSVGAISKTDLINFVESHK